MVWDGQNTSGAGECSGFAPARTGDDTGLWRPSPLTRILKQNG
jgi:hypothetical protein